MAEELLRLEGLSKYYTSAQAVVMGLNSVSLRFCRGEFVAVTGESGSGKSTLAHVIGGILPYESGEMFFAGKPTSHFDGTDYERYRAQHISFISQSYGILAGCTVTENVVSALRFAGFEKAEAKARAEDILKQVELWDLRSRRAGKLSSGQKQRLSIARALAKPAPILIADEPTGNLDPENSAKVMALLAEASRERLVILITHEFPEAADYATRHIEVKDGQIVMDLPLRQASHPAEQRELPKKRKQFLSPYVARLQLSGRPVWSTLVLLFFALTAFAVFAFLGTFIVSLDDTDTRVYDNSAFLNGERSRIVVIRSDRGPMTEEDYAAMLDVQYVRALEPWGYVTDVHYAYREGVDYDLKYDVESQGDMFNVTTFLSSWVDIRSNAPFLRTVPMLSGAQSFLTGGRLPENIFEVVAAGDASLIGTTVQVFIQDRSSWSASTKIDLQVEVVGVTDYGTGLYFHGDIGRAFNHYYTEYDWFFLYADDLANDQVRLSRTLYTNMLRYGTCWLDVPDLANWQADDETTPKLRLNLPGEGDGIPPCHDCGVSYYMQFSYDTFDRVTAAYNCDQVSLTIEDYAYTDEVLEVLHGMGYIAISPFREGSTKVNAKLAQEREQTLAVCAVALAAVMLLQIIVLRALFGAQTESYKLLSNIGMNRAAMKNSILWQLLLLTLLGQAAGMGAVWLCNQLEVERITGIIRYLPPSHILALLAVHFGASVIAALWITHTAARQVFPQGRRWTDLPLESEDAAI